ncbi:MAG TPA: LacI family DNA-binding transcriptional regulator [Trueperaceae bacterium]
MATLKDVARLAGVSTATVSHVLNASKPVSAAVRERVLDAVQELGYQRNSSARALRTGESRTLGLILPDLTNPYFPALAQTIENRARALGYALLLIDTNNDPANEAAGLRLLAEHGVDGVIWTPLGDTRPNILPFPVVVVDRPLEGLDAVFADHEQGGRLLAEYALELGHRRIGLLVGPQSLPSARLRLRGIRGALSGKADIVWQVETPFSLTLPATAEACIRQRNATLALCASDVIAIGLLRHCDIAGIRVPEDLSLLGFDDIPWASLVRPALSTIHQPLAELGRQALERLQARMAQPDLAPRHIRLPISLVKRASSQAMEGATPGR